MLLRSIFYTECPWIVWDWKLFPVFAKVWSVCLPICLFKWPNCARSNNLGLCSGMCFGRTTCLFEQRQTWGSVWNLFENRHYVCSFVSTALFSSCTLQDKDSKIAFLQKAIDVVMLVSGEPLAAKPARIIAGHEPEKTNELLQVIAKCCLNKVSPAIKDHSATILLYCRIRSKPFN